jgi:drug/metabolite transporter (DMT)-like permease
VTSGVFAAVLLGALLHAAWNALIKSGADKALDTALVTLFGVVVGLPLLAWTGLPQRAAWPYLAASALTHVGYYTALAGAYRHGELALTYPVMRGVAPLLVAIGSGPLIGEALSPGAWAAIVAVCVGVVAVGANPRALRGRSPGTALRYALANAAIIAVYTVVDGNGVRVAGNAASYIAALLLINSLPYAALVTWRRRGRGAEALAYVAGRWPLALAGAAASAASYGIALWAMTRAPVASVAALRETSVLFAALIGVVWLKERFGVLRAAGTVLIVVGMAGLRLG